MNLGLTVFFVVGVVFYYLHLKRKEREAARRLRIRMLVADAAYGEEINPAWTEKEIIDAGEADMLIHFQETGQRERRDWIVHQHAISWSGQPISGAPHKPIDEEGILRGLHGFPDIHHTLDWCRKHGKPFDRTAWIAEMRAEIEARRRISAPPA